MGKRWQVPDEGERWMTEEILQLLRGIRGRNAGKKRATVIKLAFAKANQQPLAAVFAQEDVCNQRVWYQKWQYDPQVAEAFEACYERALEWADVETAALEAHYRQRRRRSVAEYAANAPAALAAVMAGPEQRGADRISAADTLMRWAEPETAGRMAAAVPVEVQNPGDFAGVGEEELDRIIGNLQTAVGGAVDGAAATADGDLAGGGGSADVDDGSSAVSVSGPAV